jgi:hypothetical protein
MSGSNNPAVRREVFGWIAQHEHVFYDPREPIAPIGVYFSPRTRDYHPDEFIADFKGALDALLLSHREFQIVTPDTVAVFRGPALILPQRQRLDASELAALQQRKFKLIDLGANASQFEKMLSDRLPNAAAQGNKDAELENALDSLTSKLPQDSHIQVHAPVFTVSQIARVNGSTHVYLFNTKGIIAKQKLLPQPEAGAVIDFDGGAGTRVFALPFLGAVTQLASERDGDRLRVHVPAFSRSIVVWCEQ